MPLSNDTKRVLDACKHRSESGIEAMRKAAQIRFGNDTDFLIGINGSYARREATESSDVDFFFLSTGTDTSLLREKQSAFKTVLETDLNLRPPASQGVFEAPLPVGEICEIGGQQDSNKTLTRRILLLLEGEWVFNEAAFHDVRNRLLEIYLSGRPGKDKICLFLLNDIIRYWRTICIDLEHKAYIDEKAREIRLIKLRFARMLLYASAVLAIGEGHGLSYDQKIESLRKLFGAYPIDRIWSVVGNNAERVLELYSEYLVALDTPDIRQILEEGGEQSPVFQDMSNKAGRFRDSLHCLFRRHFANGNPTIRALLL